MRCNHTHSTLLWRWRGSFYSSQIDKFSIPIGKVIHVDGRVDPIEDIATINFELAISDLLQVERRIERLKKVKSKVVKTFTSRIQFILFKNPSEKIREQTEFNVLKNISKSLESGTPIRVLKLSEVEVNK